ncbi:uncharacterized protein KY384_006734 [Bacidia gigantensis]|uniref:uncharacterized protein n=1 Tax=Bacidia gigantensis TaxID=2732470 RepID=UPI001D03E563|nr:uncharacterized protein KY384_006734 [Bacidia gigantensis]KAG8528562.1 hypothetical protein KY384_006734 [Bacidia gigantensis]
MGRLTNEEKARRAAEAQANAGLGPLGAIPKLNPACTTRTSSPPKSESPSRTRDQAQSVENPFKLNAVKFHHMALCTPPVRGYDMTQLRQEGLTIPKAVEELYNKLKATPVGGIPLQLKDKFVDDANTPRKSREVPQESEYTTEDVPLPLTAEKLRDFKERVDFFVDEAQYNMATDAYERQWGHTIAGFLREFTIWSYEHGQRCRVRNIENCSIAPFEIRPVIVGGIAIRLGDGDESASVSTSNTASSRLKTTAITKMIDWTVGLVLSREDMGIIEDWYRKCLNHPLWASLSQSNSYRDALCIDIEIKRVADPDPRVQLSVWAQAGFNKRLAHGWDFTMPAPAIVIDQHIWTGYLFFGVPGDPQDPEDQGSLIMLGPMHFGTTADNRGIWQIIQKVHVLMTWAGTDYRKWFDENVIKTAKLATRPYVEEDSSRAGEHSG